MAARNWTPEQRVKQAQAIHRWQPWKQSTGARTPEGKKVSSKNAWANSLREIMRETNQTNRALLIQIREFFEYKAELEKQGITDEVLRCFVNHC